MPPTARELMQAEALRQTADQMARRDGLRAAIFAIAPNPWTGRTETYLRIYNPNKESHDDTDSNSPDHG